MVAGIARYLNNIPEIIVVEPDSAACVMESIKSGKIEKLDIKRESLMGGMSCGEVSLVPWKILKESVNCCTSVPDDNVAKTVAMLNNKYFCNEIIIGGECSTPGIISLISTCENDVVKKKLEINEKSNILIIGCEGDADEELYMNLLSKGSNQLSK